MSNIFIADIVGINTYAIPETDVALAAATAGLGTLLSGVVGLSYTSILAWVEDSHGPGGAEGVRTLNCMLQQVQYLGSECPSSAQVDILGIAIEAALEADVDITTIGIQQYNIFQTGAYQFWQRDGVSGFLYPADSDDDVAIGDVAAPVGMWFNTGKFVMGADSMNTTEMMLVYEDNSLFDGIGAKFRLAKTLADDKESWIGSSVYVDHQGGDCNDGGSGGYRGFVSDGRYNPGGAYSLVKWVGFDETFNCSTAGARVTECAGFIAQCNNAAGSDITDRYNFYVATPAAGGTIASSHGVYIDTQAAVSPTDAYAIYQSSIYDLNYFAGHVVVGNTAPSSSSCGIQVRSVTRALVVSRMTTAQRDLIAVQIVGMVLYNTTTSKLQVCTVAGVASPPGVAGTWVDLN
jgi:hypothetical protein